MEYIILAFACFFGLIFLLILYSQLKIAGPFITAKASGVPVQFSDFLGMAFQRININLITRSYIKLYKADIQVTINQLAEHHQNGGNIMRLTSALIAAKKSNIDLSWETARDIDLIGPDKSANRVIQTTSPEIIECFTS
ncbi:flotillin-like FloA family protein [Planctomycetota bacterium]|nr:flotillin-like FloA family protein [Planctomycetota bacterium]